MSDERDLSTLTIAELVGESLALEDDDERWRLVNELHRRGDEETLAAAAELTKSPDTDERVLGADILSQIAYKDPDSESAASIRARSAARLLELLARDHDAGVRAAAIQGLGSLSASAALESVLAFASDPDPETRFAVATAFPGLTGWGKSLDELGQEDAERVVAALTVLADDDDGDVRDWALFALGRQYELDSPELRELFVRHLDDSDAGARGEAIVALARRDDRRALPALLDALDPETATEEALEAAAYLADEQLLAPLEELVRAGWHDNSTLDHAIRNCDPVRRAQWAAVGRDLADTLAAAIRAQISDPSPRVHAGREPLEWWACVVGAWKRPDGSDATLSYDLQALAQTRLGGDLSRAEAVFREDVAEADGRA
jgi:HEAT repeat protein